MKKTILILLCIFTLCLISGCDSKEPVETGKEQTTADKDMTEMEKLYAEGYSVDTLSMVTPTAYVCIYFNADNEPYKEYYLLVEAPLTSEQYEEQSQFIFEDNYAELYDAFVLGLDNIIKTNLNEYMLPQSVLDEMVGKTLEEIYNDGFYGNEFTLSAKYGCIHAKKNVAEGRCSMEYIIDLDCTEQERNNDSFAIEDHLDAICTCAGFYGFEINEEFWPGLNEETNY